MLPIIDSTKHIQSSLDTAWIFHLMRELPNLLCLMLKNQCCQSLERLQLINVSISLKKDNLKINPTCFVEKEIHVPKKKEDLLILQGTLKDNVSCVLDFKASYFLRSQRKFLIKCPPAIKAPSVAVISAVSTDMIKKFFSQLGQSNTFYYSTSLAKLNGRKEVSIPSQCCLALALSAFFHHHGTSQGPLKFDFTFHYAAPINEELFLASAFLENAFIQTISYQQKPLISLRATP